MVPTSPEKKEAQRRESTCPGSPGQKVTGLRAKHSQRSHGQPLLLHNVVPRFSELVLIQKEAARASSLISPSLRAGSFYFHQPFLLPGNEHEQKHPLKGTFCSKKHSQPHHPSNGAEKQMEHDEINLSEEEHSDTSEARGKNKCAQLWNWLCLKKTLSDGST